MNESHCPRCGAPCSNLMRRFVADSEIQVFRFTVCTNFQCGWYDENAEYARRQISLFEPSGEEGNVRTAN